MIGKRQGIHSTKTVKTAKTASTYKTHNQHERRHAILIMAYDMKKTCTQIRQESFHTALVGETGTT